MCLWSLMFSRIVLLCYITGCSCSWNFNGWRCSFDGPIKVLSCNRKNCGYIYLVRDYFSRSFLVYQSSIYCHPYRFLPLLKQVLDFIQTVASHTTILVCQGIWVTTISHPFFFCFENFPPYTSISLAASCLFFLDSRSLFENFHESA